MEEAEMVDVLGIPDPSSGLFDLTMKFGSDPPLKRILQIILSQDCHTILVEHDYVDEEWASEHQLFYSKTFKNPPDKTERLHFFTSNLNQEDLTKLGNYQQAYLGFCVLRPLESRRVVNAVIRPMEDKNNPKKSFVLCKAVFPVQIKIAEGNVQHLEVTGFPFIQQDGQLGCCSHVALAVIDRFLLSEEKPERKHKKDEPFLVGDIVESVSLVPELQRLIPTEGLLPVQISEALKAMGYSPLVYEYGKGRERLFSPERIIYHYLESKLPVIVGIPTATAKHALTIIGHSFEPDLWWALAEKPYYNSRPSGIDHHCSTTWLQNFIVQDDNFGPYLTIPKEFIWAAEREELVIIVPLPANVNIKGEDAETIAYTLVRSAATLIKMEQQRTHEEEEDAMAENISGEDVSNRAIEWLNIFYEHLENDDLVLRTWLLESEVFKKKYMSPTVKDLYQGLKMPKKIWLTEVSIPELFCQTRLRLGEVIIDPTGAKFRTSFLAIHLPGFVITRNVDTEELGFSEVENDQPFRHVMR